MKQYDGQLYYDDRLFLLHLCLGTVHVEGEVVTTTIHHENPPPEAKWCLVTYRNCDNYPAISVLHFQNREDAIMYRQMVEPTTPLISYQGQSVMPPLSYDEYTRWKIDEHLGDYDYRKCYRPGGTNPKEMFLQTREQYVASAKRVRGLLARLPK